MGDVLHALPAVAALRRLHPDWFIGWVIDYRWKPLLEAEGCCPTPGRSEGRPIVDRIHEIPTQAWKHKPMTRTTLEGIMRLRRELRAEQYELCIDLKGLIRSALVGSVSGSRRFIGRDWPRERPARWLYQHRIKTPAPHVVDQGCELVSAAVCETIRPGRVMLPVDPAAERWVDETLEKALPREYWNRFCFVAPTAGWGSKAWPKERYGELAIRLAEAGWATLVNAAPAKHGVSDPSAQAVVDGALGCAVAVPSTLAQMLALIRRASLVIGGDSGPIHLAAALERPVVSLFGPTDPDRTGPRGPKIRVLRHAISIVDHSRREETEQGLALITTGEVFVAAMELLQGSDKG